MEVLNKGIEAAKKAAKNAHTPYSKFNVGVALITSNGDVIPGHNIENASYTPTMCAERVAIAHGHIQGYDLKTVETVVVYSEKPHLVSPCGVCRQTLVEFISQDTSVVMVNGNDEKVIMTLRELLPKAFTPDDL